MRVPHLKNASAKKRVTPSLLLMILHNLRHHCDEIQRSSIGLGLLELNVQFARMRDHPLLFFHYSLSVRIRMKCMT